MAQAVAENVLLIFAKFPQPGQVKTRLAQDVGAEHAAALYRVFVETVVRQTQSPQWHSRVLFAPAAQAAAFQRWLGAGIMLVPQADGDLTPRLQQAFAQVFQCGARRVVCIGSDSPQLNAADIAAAFAALSHDACVLGPAPDGGYYLIGLTEYLPQVFENITWSTAAVYDQTMARLQAQGIAPALLAAQDDVDTIADLRQLAARLRATGCTGTALWRVVQKYY